MKMVMPANPPKKHRCPAESIRHAGWLYFRVCLSYRDGEELLFARGIILFDARLLQFSDGADHLGGTPLLVVPLAVPTHLVQLLWRGRHDELEHVLAVVGVKIFE